MIGFAVLNGDDFVPMLNLQNGWLILPYWIGVIVFASATFLLGRVNRRIVVDAEAMGCIGCGYCLNGNTSGTCPECGTMIPN